MVVVDRMTGLFRPAAGFGSKHRNIPAGGPVPDRIRNQYESNFAMPPQRETIERSDARSPEPAPTPCAARPKQRQANSLESAGLPTETQAYDASRYLESSAFPNTANRGRS